MLYQLIIIVGSLFFLISSLVSAVNQNNLQARVFLDSKPQLLQLLDLHPDIVWTEADYVEIITNPGELAELESLGFQTEIVIGDLKGFFKSRLDKDRSMGGYLTLSEINNALDVIVADHSDIVSAKVDLGQTIEGRTMWAVKISDNPNVDEDEPEVLFTSAIHAREVITPLILLNVMDSLTEKYTADPYIQNLVDNREMWFILCVNPDGYYHNEFTDPGGGGWWRKNRRDNGDGTWGVDLNRNFGYNWGLDDIGSSPDGIEEDYRGIGAFSEPETQNIRDFTINHDFKIVVYYHAYGNIILWPWAYNRLPTPDENLYIGLGDSTSVFTGYTPNYIRTLYPTNGGAYDWHYGEQTAKNKSFGFVIEVGTYDDNFWPPTNRIEDLVNENYFSTLFLADASDHIEQVPTPNPPELILSETAANSNYQVAWTHTDTHNPATKYELVEYQDMSISTDPADNFGNFTNNDFLISSARYHSNFSSFYSGMEANFPGNLVTANPILITSGDIFRFWTYYSIEPDYDYAYVAVCPDLQTWTNIEGNITTNDNPFGNNRGNGITGVSGAWIQAEFDLSAYDGQAIYISLLYRTDGNIEEEGIYFDDIEMITSFGTTTVVASNIEENFYAFSNKDSEKDYFYQVRAQDADQQWSNFSEMRKIHTYACGEVNGIAAINILDVVFLINYKYKDGPAPDPLNAGDVDGTPPINILDIVYLINNIYKDGLDLNCL